MAETIETQDMLVVEQMPEITSYKPGQKISFDGIRIMYGQDDVTDKVKYNIEEGTPWDMNDDKLDVVVSYTAENGLSCSSTFQFTRKSSAKKLAIILPLVAIAAVGIGYAVWHFALQPPSETGSRFIMKGDMSDEEAQALLDEQAEASRITVSLAPEMKLKNTNELRVNFVVAEPNNGFSERLELEQDGRIVYKSQVIEPGYRLEWVTSNGAKTGPATATVYAVTSDGVDTGNPVSVEVQIVDNE